MEFLYSSLFLGAKFCSFFFFFLALLKFVIISNKNYSHLLLLNIYIYEHVL